MSEDVARAVGAGKSGKTIAGKPFSLRPLTVRELTEIERDCVKWYRRQYLQNIKDAAEFLPNADEELRKAVFDSAKWEVDDLPKKWVYDTSKIPITPELEIWLKRNLDVKDSALADKDTVKRLVSAALDQELLSAAEFKKYTGSEPKKISTGYANWWATGSFEGMTTMVFYCVRGSGITMDDIRTDLANKQADLMSLSREIEDITAPSLGNG